MALKKTLSERIFKISKFPSQCLTNCRISSSTGQTRILQTSTKANIAPEPGDSGIFRRVFHKKAIICPELPMQIGGNLMEKLRVFDFARDRIRLDGLSPSVTLPVQRSQEKSDLTVADARKLLRVAQLETVKSRFREMEEAWLPYSEFVRICGECCSDPDQGIRFAKTLDESGTVIVLGNVVFLKPEQVAKAVGGLIPLPATNPNDPRRKELEAMEKVKAEVDRKADAMVRRELWGGLAFLVIQTAGFMRLTFWELSWDVMEPICFYLTSIYCMVGYTFFLRTSREPSFEGFYQSRFIEKQKRLMKLHNFDLQRYNELQKLCYPILSSPRQNLPIASFDEAERICQNH